MTDLIWKTEQRKVSELVPYEKNPRKMTEEQVRVLTESLNRFNLVEIPAIDIDNTIVAGHQRLKIMQLAGRAEEVIDVRVPSRKLTDEEFREYLVRSNKNVGEWDWVLLKSVGEDLLLTAGFTMEELMMGFGLSDARETEVDEARIKVLTVLPPESPKLKEKAEIHFETVEDYEKVREAVAGGKISAASLLKLLA